MVAELFRADGRSDMHGEANNGFSQCYESVCTKKVPASQPAKGYIQFFIRGFITIYLKLCAAPTTFVKSYFKLSKIVCFRMI